MFTARAVLHLSWVTHVGTAFLGRVTCACDHPCPPLSIIIFSSRFVLFLTWCMHFCFPQHFYSPLQPVGGFTPKRPSEQAVVTGAFPFPPRYMPSLLSRIGLSIPIFSAFQARRFSSNFAHSQSCAFRSSTFTQEKVPTSTCMHSVRLEPTTLTLLW